MNRSINIAAINNLCQIFNRVSDMFLKNLLNKYI